MMKKILCLILATMFTFSLGTALAPACAASELPALIDGAEIMYDAESGCIKGIDPGTSAEQLAALFSSEVTLLSPASTVLSPSDALGTGCTVSSGDASATVYVYGDINCDAKVNARDVVEMLRLLVTSDREIPMASADLVPDNLFNIKDVTALLKYLVGYDIPLGTRYWKVTNDKQTAPAEDVTMKMSFFDSLAKNAPDSDVISDNNSFFMHLAKNETESCQAEIYSFEKQTGLRAKLSDFTDHDGNVLASQLLYVQYIKLIENGSYNGTTVPDALPPMPTSFNIAADRRQGLYIEVSSTEDTVPGLYRARLDIENADGEVVKTAYVYAEVWDFTLPVESHIRTAFGLGIFNINTRAVQGENTEDNALYIQYYEYLLNNRINPWCLPFNPSDDRADVWMSDPRVNTFLVAGGYNGDVYNNMAHMDDPTLGNVVDETALATIAEKLRTNSDWMKKQITYCTDEPGVVWPGTMWGLRNKLGEAQAQYEMFQRVFPEGRIIIPVAIDFMQDIYDDKIVGDAALGDLWGWGHVDALEVAARFSNVLCPCIDIYTPPETDVPGVQNHYSYDHVATLGTMKDRVAAWKEQGKESWWYTANSPKLPMANIGQRWSGLQNRITLWETYAYDVTGFLYWTTNEWGSRKRMQIDITAGILVYCGSDFGTTGPVACQRAGIFRDGMEDVEYLYIAKELLGEEYVNGVVKKLVRDTVDYEKDPATLLAVRNELGAAIAEATAASGAK